MVHPPQEPELTLQISTFPIFPLPYGYADLHIYSLHDKPKQGKLKGCNSLPRTTTGKVAALGDLPSAEIHRVVITNDSVFVNLTPLTPDPTRTNYKLKRVGPR